MAKKKSITNIPANNYWGYEDTPFEKYDEAVLIPHIALDDGKGGSVFLNEIKRKVKVGKTYKIKPEYSDKKLKAKLIAVYSDPVGFGDHGKKTPVRLATEWKFLEGDYHKGKHMKVMDFNIDYHLKSKKRKKVEERLHRKHGYGVSAKRKTIEEIKKLIKEKKY